MGVSNSLKLENKYETFYKAETFLKTKGYKIKRGKYIFEDYYGSAGTREQKAEDMMSMFKDPEVKMILCLDGGQTCNTFIDLLDYEVIKQNPKILMGYSDITVLLQAIYQKTGLITFSGPSFVSFGEVDPKMQYKELQEVFVNKKLNKFINGDKSVVRPGCAEGKIIGTNLGSMMYLFGTEYFPNIENAILTIESYITSPNECQRRFAHLKQYGVFDKISGVIVGYNYDLQKNGNIFPQMEDVLMKYTKEYNFPIIKCNDFGHKIVNGIVPIGATLSIKNDNFKILDDFVA